jgi:hypothetical protein
MSFDYKKVSATAGIFCLGGVILLLVNGVDEETIGKFFKKSETQEESTQNTMFSTPEVKSMFQPEVPTPAVQPMFQPEVPTQAVQAQEVQPMFQPEVQPMFQPEVPPEVPTQDVPPEVPTQDVPPEIPTPEIPTQEVPTEVPTQEVPTEVQAPEVPTQAVQAQEAPTPEVTASETGVQEDLFQNAPKTGLTSVPQDGPQDPSNTVNPQSGGTRKKNTVLNKTRRCCKYCNREQD